MRKKAVYGTAFWITKDGNIVRADNHLESLVNRSFDLDALQSEFGEFILENYITEAGIAELESEGIPFNPNEPGAPQVITDEQLHEFMYTGELTPLQIGEIPSIAKNLYNMGAGDAGEFLLQLVQKHSMSGFEKVVYGTLQPYHFAFLRGDIRVRVFANAFAVELASFNLNRTNAGRILDVLLKLKNPPPNFLIDLVDFSGDDVNTRSYSYSSMEEFIEALTDLTRRRVANLVDCVLKYSSIFYKKAQRK